MFLGNSERVALLIRGGRLNEASEKAVIRDLGILVRDILQVHELLLLLPREAAKPQASFLLRDCFGRSDLGASVVLTNMLSAYEYRFEDVLAKVNIEQKEREALKRAGDVLCQAFVDKDNPLAWAVLAHEYGHALDAPNAISRATVQGVPNPGDPGDDPKPQPDPDLGEAVVAETVADFIAAHVLGPASLMPILFVEMLFPKLTEARKTSAGHPPTPLRVRMVCDYLKDDLKVGIGDFEMVFEAYKLDHARKLQDMEEGEREVVRKIGKEVENLLSPLAEKISSGVGSLQLPRFEEANAARARELRQALESRQPISSRKPRTNEEVFKSLSSLTAEAKPEDVYKALAQLDEVPVRGSEILTAGWLYRLSSFEKFLMTTFPEGGRGADLNAYAEYVEKTDGWLSKSLELAAVHTEVSRRGEMAL